MKTARHRSRPDRVHAWTEWVVFPTYRPAAPDRNPMFLEKRVYQGSTGRVYPLPFTDRIGETREPRRWQAVWIENAFLRVLVLPELGGRIHRILDRTNGYDLIYYQPVIKPALVGLAGPWVSGGIEFNWPQHHRPSTFLPADVAIDHHPDGSKTIWCGDHDPLTRLKGMHGVCLHPGRAIVELKARIHNRTPVTQTFLWWANAAIRVHEAYQSFFPPDVHFVADHARRATSAYPLAHGVYYGVDYGRRARHGLPANEIPPRYRPPSTRHAAAVVPGSDRDCPAYAPNDLSWYANIPTPCSYMALGSREDFLGGYDYRAQAGLVHVVDHHIAPGKKQWTWGNHPFGYAWDRHLTDPAPDGEYPPYIELMSGVYTDNQPDFSFLAPGETRTWSQYWYPIQQIGPVQSANIEAAVSLGRDPRRRQIGICVTRPHPGASIRWSSGRHTQAWKANLAPGRPWMTEMPFSRSRSTRASNEGSLRVLDRDGREIIACSVAGGTTPGTRAVGKPPPPATEPLPPRAMRSIDELFLTGLHLEQYRHATRCPTAYWREALRRDPLDSRCHTALGRWHLQRGEFAVAETHFRSALRRLTARNANPFDGEPFYHLGLCLRHLGRDDDAYDAFFKATWNQAWAGPALLALAEIDCGRQHWDRAHEHLQQVARHQSDNLRAMNLQAMVAARRGQTDAAKAIPRRNRAIDPLDWWARHLLGDPTAADLQTRLDLAHDFARAGFVSEAIRLLSQPRPRRRALPDQSWGAEPLVEYTLAWLHEQLGNTRAARAHHRAAAAAVPDYCFPARLEEIGILTAARRRNPRDARAPYYLGNLLYDRRRHDEAIRCWEHSARLDPDFAVVWRNLGIAYFNIRRDPARSRAAYEKAFRADPRDARLLFERDQLWKRLGIPPLRRRRELERSPALVEQRDDLTLELCALLNLTGQPDQAARLLARRRFQPWEGGEGAVLGLHVLTHRTLGFQALAQGQAARARDHFELALHPPENLGEVTHLLANQSDLHYGLGCACQALGQTTDARRHWTTATRSHGDFHEMRVQVFSEKTHFSALAWPRLGQPARARKLWRALLRHARRLGPTPARIDYFATSLPTMLLFEDDLTARQKTTALFLEAQARLGLGQHRRAQTLLRTVRLRDPSHLEAAALQRELKECQ